MAEAMLNIPTAAPDSTQRSLIKKCFPGHKCNNNAGWLKIIKWVRANVSDQEAMDALQLLGLSKAQLNSIVGRE
eukprot:14026753-Alexandrium_andersonii.AAC.1